MLYETLAPATRAAIGDERLASLRALPHELRVGEDLIVLHAAPGDLWRAPTPDADDVAFENIFGALDARIVVYGHIHRPFVRRVGGRVIANSGSVGMCYDGDPQASYLLVTDGDVHVKRVQYDVDREIADLFTAGYPLAGWLAEVRRTGTFTPPPERRDDERR